MTYLQDDDDDRQVMRLPHYTIIVVGNVLDKEVDGHK